jgi:hypothetical protein
VFPDTLERLFGVGYGFKGSWGVSEWEFELLTLGTLAIIVVVGLVGYAVAAPVRHDIAISEGDRPQPTELPPEVAT